PYTTLFRSNLSVRIHRTDGEHIGREPGRAGHRGHRFPAGAGVLVLAGTVALQVPGRGDDHHIAVVGVFHRGAERTVGGVQTGLGAGHLGNIDYRGTHVHGADHGTGEREHGAVTGGADLAGSVAVVVVLLLVRQAQLAD